MLPRSDDLGIGFSVGFGIGLTKFYEGFTEALLRNRAGT